MRFVAAPELSEIEICFRVEGGVTTMLPVNLDWKGIKREQDR